RRLTGLVELPAAATAPPQPLASTAAPRITHRLRTIGTLQGAVQAHPPRPLTFGLRAAMDRPRTRAARRLDSAKQEITTPMCGIVGYVGPRKPLPLLLTGLEKLEYRGYDSAGISVLDGDRIDAVRAVGNLSALRGALDARRSAEDGAVAVAERPQPGTGVGHTRWATHGRVTEENAHPHFDTTDRIHIVVNGIVENYVSLKNRLVADG